MPTMYTVLYSKYLNQFKEAKCLHMRRYSLDTSRVLSLSTSLEKAFRIAKKKIQSYYHRELNTKKSTVIAIWYHKV